MPNAFILATGADTGGSAIRITEAFRANRVNDWRVRSMVSSTNYINYDRDLPYDLETLFYRYDTADVVLLNSTMIGHELFDGGHGKSTVLMHHGLHKGHFKLSLEESILDGMAKNAVQIGSTVNLELYGPITWAPIPYDLRKLAEMRRGLFKPSKTLRIGHAPTDRAVKSTESVISAVKQLKTEGYDVELVLIERKTHRETLIAKAAGVDLYIDQVILGYGCNAIEAWGMGIPVIAGIDRFEHSDWIDHAVARYQCASPLGLPFYYADGERNIYHAIKAFLTNENLLSYWAKVGLDHVQKWHSLERGVEIYSEVFERAKETRTPPMWGRRRKLSPEQHEIRSKWLRDRKRAEEAERLTGQAK